MSLVARPRTVQGRILVVDDDEDVRTVVTIALGGTEYDVDA